MCSERLKRAFLRFFGNIWETKLKRFSGKMRQNVQKCLNRNLIRGSFLENMLKATLTSKANVLSVWKGHFLFFYKFLSDEVETVFSEKEAKHLIIFKSKFGHRKLLRKWFWSYRDLKNECSEHLKWSFFSFLQIFEWWGQNHFPGK